MPFISCCRRAPASPPPPGDVIVVAAAADITAGRRRCIGRRGSRPRCTPWRAMPCISRRHSALVSPPPPSLPPPSGDVIVVVAAAALAVGWRLCCSHAPSCGRALVLQGRLRPEAAPPLSSQPVMVLPLFISLPSFIAC